MQIETLYHTLENLTEQLTEARSQGDGPREDEILHIIARINAGERVEAIG